VCFILQYPCKTKKASRVDWLFFTELGVLARRAEWLFLAPFAGLHCHKRKKATGQNLVAFFYLASLFKQFLKSLAF
jgi:hypothetical protein